MAPGQRREFVTAVELGRPTAVKEYRCLCGRSGGRSSQPPTALLHTDPLPV